MGNEFNIEATTYRNEWHKLRVNLLFSSIWLSKGIQEVLKPLGLTRKQYNVLGIVKQHEGELPLTVLEIRDLMIDKMSDASRLIDRMHKKGVIRKFPCTMDKRAIRVELTQKGEDLVDAVESNIDKLDNLVGSLSESEAQTMNTLLEKMRHS